MASEDSIRRYRNWYRRLLRLYPKQHRERFGEGMEQTFHDLCQERARAGRRFLGGFVLWMFVETSAGIIRENGRFVMMQNNIIRIAIVVGVLLLFPLWANHNIDGWNWDLLDFVFMGALLFGTGLTFELAARKGSTMAYRAAVGIACATGLILVWINAAVGIIGDGPVNLMYLGVLAVGFVGASIARFRARGMALALFATAVAQMLVPLIAMIWVPAIDFAPGVAAVMSLNACFIALWLVSALLFRRAARKHIRRGTDGLRGGEFKGVRS